MPTIIVMPQLGESVAEGIIGKWLKGEGEQVDKDEPIVEVITDKVNAEIPSPVAGTLRRISQPEGATVEVGQEIAVIDDDGGSGQQPVPVTSAAGNGHGTAGQQTASSPQGPAASELQTNTPQLAHVRVEGAAAESSSRGERVRSSPLVRRLAQEHGINLAEISGTGIGGRVSKQDIVSYVERRQSGAGVAGQDRGHFEAGNGFERDVALEAPPVRPEGVAAAPPSQVPQPPAVRPPGAREELVPVSPLRKIIAERMVLSKFTIPHATTMAEVDVTSVVRYREANKDEFRRREGVPLSYVAFVIKATVEALKQFPVVNAEWRGDSILIKHDININVAVDAPEGLTTPVIPNADHQSLAGLSSAIYDLAMRARNKKLRVEDMQGGTFTVNNTGAIGSVSGVSIINYPQGGILNAGAIVKRPVVMELNGEDSIAIRSMMNLSFTFDHRLLDGGYAAGFVQAVKRKLETWNADYPLY